MVDFLPAMHYLLFSTSMTLPNSFNVQLTDFMVPMTPIYHVLRVSSIIWTGVVCCIDVSVQKAMLYPCTDRLTTGCNCMTARRTANVPRVPSLPSVGAPNDGFLLNVLKTLLVYTE